MIGRQGAMRFLSVVLAVAMLVGVFAGSISADETVWDEDALAASVDLAVTYIGEQQLADGGLPGFSEGSDVGTSALGLVAISLLGADSEQPLPDTMLDVQGLTNYVVSNTITYTHDAAGVAAENLFPGRAGQVLTSLGLSALALESSESLDAVVDQTVGQLEETLDATTGAYTTSAQEEWTSGAATASSQAWSILGLSILGRAVPDAALAWLVEQQAPDGSFGDGDPDSTALAGVALLSSGQYEADAPSIQAIRGYFQDTQLESAGWRPSWDVDPLNADTTGWVVQFLLMAGEDVDGDGWQSDAGVSSRQALAGLQTESGVIGGTYANLYSTIEALFGLANQPILAVETSTDAPVSAVEGISRVGLVIEKSDGTIITRCVTFEEQELNGVEILERSGLELAYSASAQGTAICSIDGDGCPAGDCFCDFPDRYWSYWQWVDGEWQYAPAGAMDVMVSDGEIQGWANTLDAQPPSFTPELETICQQEPASEVASPPVAPTLEVSPLATTVASPEPSVAPTLEVASTTDDAASVVTATPSEASEVPGQEPNETAGYVVLAVLLIALTSAFFVARRKRR